MIPKSIQDFIKPSVLQIQSDFEPAGKYRPRSQSGRTRIEKSNNNSVILQNYRVVTSQGRRCSSQSRGIQPHKKRVVYKYVNGANDSLNMELRKPLDQSQAMSTYYRSNNNDSEGVKHIEFFSQKKQEEERDRIALSRPMTSQPAAAREKQITETQGDANLSTSLVVSDNCFEMDLNFLDNIQLSDAQVQKMLQDLGLQDGVKGVDLEKIVAQNQDYLHHMFCNCACFKCICGRCKCAYAQLKLTFKNGFRTMYGREYNMTDATQLNNGPTLYQTHYETLTKVSNNQPIEGVCTTHQSFYQPHPLQQRWKRVQQSPAVTPFMATSTYQKSFKNWQDYDPKWNFKRPQHSSVMKESPFYDQTNYSIHYSGKAQDPNLSADDIKKRQSHKTYLREYPDQNKTMYMETYLQSNAKPTKLPFKYKTQTQVKYPVHNKEYNPINAYDTQYLSVTKQSYRQPKVRICPAQEMTRIKRVQDKQLQEVLIRKIRELASKKQN